MPRGLPGKFSTAWIRRFLLTDVLREVTEPPDNLLDLSGIALLIVVP